MAATEAPAWARDVLAAPGGTGAASVHMEAGVLRFGVPSDDASIAFYKSVGGADFHARAKIGYAMGTLDTPIYADYLTQIRPSRSGALVADIGGGDGRNVLPWLAETDARIVVVDPIIEGLFRFRQRLETENPQWLDRVLLIEGDARKLPLRDGAFDAVQSIETLAYLNEDYAVGLKECRRLMSDGSHLLVADRDYEGALMLQLLYFDRVAGMLKQADGVEMWDGSPGNLVRSRCFTQEQLVEMAESCGLHVLERLGISSLSLVLSYLRSEGKLGGYLCEVARRVYAGIAVYVGEPIARLVGSGLGSVA